MKKEPRWRKPPPLPTPGIRQTLARLRARWRMANGVTPLSELWGSDRGQQVHRLYVERFIAEFADDIKGRCLEFQDPAYVPRFGGTRVQRLDILHADDSNPRATLVADLTAPNDLPGDVFDSIVCTHVLHVIFDARRAVRELHRLLRPGGVLLVAVPHISMCDPELYEEFWRFTPAGLRRLLGDTFGDGTVTVRAYGNSLTSAGDLRGLVAHEFTGEELDYVDERFALEVCGRAVKR